MFFVVTLIPLNIFIYSHIYYIWYIDIHQWCSSYCIDAHMNRLWKSTIFLIFLIFWYSLCLQKVKNLMVQFILIHWTIYYATLILGGVGGREGCSHLEGVRGRGVIAGRVVKGPGPAALSLPCVQYMPAGHRVGQSHWRPYTTYAFTLPLLARAGPSPGSENKKINFFISSTLPFHDHL